MKDSIKPLPHSPVLYHEIIQAIAPHAGGKYIDGTLGAGGHTQGILKHSSPDGCVLGIDLDQEAIEIAAGYLSSYQERVIIRHGSYVDLEKFAAEIGWKFVDGIILDLGVSSIQLDNSQRGFSFMRSGNLDMRFGTRIEKTAADLINSASEEELAKILWQYGEEKFSRRIARLIVKNRPLVSTNQLANLVIEAYRNKHSQHHPATRTFQAIRIAVNRELEAIETVLPRATSLLKPGGRLAVISFHSLEDRLVKTYFRQESSDCICPPEQPVCNCNHKKTLKEVNRKPIEPTKEEKESNPRARSAKLRIAERLKLA
jgi:16S rRNA (cytosine1402-N4)-methyltransferase